LIVIHTTAHNNFDLLTKILNSTLIFVKCEKSNVKRKIFNTLIMYCKMDCNEKGVME